MMDGPVSATDPDVSGQSDSLLDATAQLLTFESGMYAVDFHAPRPAQTNAGLSLPCARLDAMPQSAEFDGKAFVSMTSVGGWLSHGDLPTFIRVVGGKAGVLLTIYKGTGGMPAPELRVRYIRDDLHFPPTPSAAGEGAAPGFVSAPAADQTPPVQVLVHAQERGDIRAAGDQWAGSPGSRKSLEGFGIILGPQSGIAPGELEYQAILGDTWNTPWFAAGEFCGSRGMALPILGFRARLTGHAAELYECSYSGSFVGLGEVGPVADGAACEGGGRPMDALRVALTPRAATAGAAPGPHVRPKRRRRKRP